MQIISACAELQHTLAKRHGTLAFVPTMGALHAGHLSLVKLAAQHATHTLVSIFVNPAQFAADEDLDTYPRRHDEDLQKLRAHDVDLVFTPTPTAIYPPRFQTWVTNAKLADDLCGRSRPQHFRGVLTVMLKFLLMIKPQLLLLGKKDYQQLVIVKRMIADLNLPVTVVAGETQRAADGLALSSRLTYLRPAERRVARSIYPALCAAQQRYRDGERRTAQILQTCATQLAKTPDLNVEYLELRALPELTPITSPTLPPTTLLLVAARVAQTRLIDNIELAEI